MGTLTTLRRFIGHHCLRKSRPSPHISNLLHWSQGSLLNVIVSGAFNLQYQSRRTLILESALSESVKLKRLSDSGIVEVNLDRPETRNAIGKDMLRGLKHAFETINEDQSAKVVLVCSSVPKVFCAGADLKERKMMTPSEVKFSVNKLRSMFSFIEGFAIDSYVYRCNWVSSDRLTVTRPPCTLFLEALRVPTIAVIEGAALGGGLEMALSCDLRICGEEAKLGLPETGLAIIPGAGGMRRLPRLVGKSVAKELIFTGRKIGGREAMMMGLVNYCLPAGEAHLKALEIAREINQKGPIAIRMAKKAINHGIEMDLASALELEEECYDQTLHTKDRLEGLAAFAEKRKPRYSGD